jgi:hypothetical protein
MGIEVRPATGQWDDFASFMVSRKPGGSGRVCIAYRNSSLDMPGRIAHMRAVRQRTGSRRPGVPRRRGGRLVLGRAEIHLPCPGQLADDPARPGRGRLVGGLLRGPAGIPAPRDASAAGWRGRARGRYRCHRAGRLPGRPRRPAHRPDQRLCGHPPSSSRHTDSGAFARPRAARRQAPLARAPRASITRRNDMHRRARQEPGSGPGKYSALFRRRNNADCADVVIVPT